MVRKRLLLLLKPFDVYPSHETIALPSNRNKMLKVLRYLDDERLVHKNAISFCQNILKKKAVEWKAVFRNDLAQSIRRVDLVISIGGDGTLLQASHFVDDSIPVLGVNSDPTQQEELLNDILENHSEPSEVSRMAISVNSKLISTSALNDILVTHPCPATVSRLSFRKEYLLYSIKNCILL